MWMQPRRLALAIVMVVAGYFLLTQTQSSNDHIDVIDNNTLAPILLFADNIRTVQFDASGTRQHVITGTRLAQRDADETRIQNPSITLYQGSQLAWRVTADEATVEKGEQFHLSNNVLADKLSGNKVNISTISLDINTQTGLVSTKDPVTMVAQHVKLTAVGMTFDVENESIAFLSQVHTQYEANNE